MCCVPSVPLFSTFHAFLNLSLLSKSPPTEGDTEVQRCGCCRGLLFVTFQRFISALISTHTCGNRGAAAGSWGGTSRSSRRPGGCCAQNDVADGGVKWVYSLVVGNQRSKAISNSSLAGPQRNHWFHQKEFHCPNYHLVDRFETREARLHL